MTLGPRVINDNWQFAQRLCSFGSLGMIVNGLQKSSCVTRVCGAAARGGRSWTGGMFDHPKVSPSQPNNIVNKSLHKISSEAPAMVNMAEQETNRKKQNMGKSEGPTRNRTGVAGIRIRSDNRYTIEPSQLVVSEWKLVSYQCHFRNHLDASHILHPLHTTEPSSSGTLPLIHINLTSVTQ
jgi:hypothetical protein